ncbi:hypothetical protein GCM10025795_44190 [Verticiella sediminum]
MSAIVPIDHGDRHGTQRRGERQGAQRAARQAILDRAARRQRQAEARLGQLEIGDGVDGFDLRRDRRQALLEQRLLDDRTGVRGAWRQYPAELAQPLPAQAFRAARPELAGRAHHDPGLVADLFDHETLGTQAAEFGGRVHGDQHVDIAGVELVADVGEPAFGQADLGQIPGGAQGPQQFAHAGPGEKGRGADAQQRVVGRGARGELVRELRHLAKQHAGPLHDEFAGGGSDHATGQAVKDPGVEQGLDLAQAFADGRRAHVQAFAGGAHVPGVRQRADHFELAQAQGREHALGCAMPAGIPLIRQGRFRHG